MKDINNVIWAIIAILLICLISDSINKDRDVQIKELDRQWKLDSTDKAERRKMDKDLKTLRLKLQNESR